MDLLRHLEFFVAIAEEEHFGRAATRLGMTQPPLSQGLQRLEQRLGVALIERSSRGVRLNAAGRDLLPRARALLHDGEELRRIAGAHSAAAASIRIGIVPQVDAATAAAVAVACQAGGGLVELISAPTPQLVDAVTAGQLDLAIVVHPAVLGALRSGPVIRRDTAVLLPADHPAAGGDGPVAVRHLRGLDVATMPRAHNPAAHDLLLDGLEERGLRVQAVAAEDDRAALVRVATGRAFMITADAGLTASGVVRRALAGEPLPLRLRVVWRGTEIEPAVHAAVQEALR